MLKGESDYETIFNMPFAHRCRAYRAAMLGGLALSLSVFLSSFATFFSFAALIDSEFFRQNAVNVALLFIGICLVSHFIMMPKRPNFDVITRSKAWKGMHVRFNGVWLDLTAWQHKHPGGPQWIEYYDGRDATEAMNAIHSMVVI